MSLAASCLLLLAAVIDPDWSLENAYREQTGARRRISLNGYWRFRPCDAGETALPDQESYPAWFLVPGYWRSCGFGNFAHDGSGAVLREIGGRKVESFPAAFYRRTINPPRSMSDGEVRLYFDLVFTRVKIWINGREIPLARQQTRRFHVSVGEHLKFGEENDLVVRCESDNSARYGDRAGMRSDVWLEYRPKLHLGEPSVVTSLSLKRIELSCNDATLADGSPRLSRRILDAKTNEEVYSDEVPFSAKTVVPFVTPKLWAPDSPNLYYLELAARDSSGRTVDAARVRFGFREFKIHGAEYLLNGKPIEVFCDSSWPTRWSPQWHLEPDYVRKAFRTYRAMNMNALYAHPFVLPESFFDIADEEGFLLLFAVTKPEGNIHAEDFNAFLPKYEAYAEAQSRTRAWRNHPSNIGVLADIWYNYHLGTRNPAYIGMTESEGDPNLRFEQPTRRAEAVKKMISVCERNFPGAVVFTGADGHAGALYSSHVYHTWGAPPAELSAMFSRYGKNRKLPIFLGEMNLQYPGAFSDLRDYSGQPYFAENGARFLGEEAYRLEPVKSEFFCAGPDNDLLRSTWDCDKPDRREYAFISDVYSRTLAEYLDRTIFSWRLDGVNGIGFFEYVMSARYLLSTRSFSNFSEVKGDLTRPGNKTEQPWGSHHRPPFETGFDVVDLRPNPAAAVFRRVTAPLAAEFVSSGSDRYSRGHAWFGGERVEKALAIINRTNERRFLDVRLSLEDSSGALLYGKSGRIEVGAWTNQIMRFSMPTATVLTRTEATLRAVLTENGRDVTVASMAVQLFPVVDRAANAALSVAVVGSEEFTGKVSALGFKVSDKAPVKIFAPLSMSDSALRKRAKAAIDAGENVLVMEQRGEASPELVKVRQRKVFLNAADHPCLREFKNADFADWRSRALTVPDYGTPRASEQWTDWGARNIVAGYVFRRPSHGNDLSLLTCGFDLFETPLIERHGEKGTALFSQLELGGSLGVDPVATRLFVNLVGYLNAWRAPRRDVGLVASEKGRGWLSAYGVKGSAIDVEKAVDFSRYSALVVRSPDFKALRRRAMELNDYVEGGGRVVYLHDGGVFHSTWLPFALEIGNAEKLRQTLVGGLSDATWRNGWGACEFLWREEPEMPVFTKVPRSCEATDPAVVVRRKVGAGEWILVSASPELLKDASCGKVDRLVSAILTSAGVTVDEGAFPYAENFHRVKSFTNEPWEFSEDGSRWVSGQMTIGGDSVKAGCSWKRFLENDYRGTAWYRLRFTLDEREATNEAVMVTLRNLVGVDETFVNGRKVGAYGKAGADRGYRIPKNVLKAGENVLLVKVTDASGNGGLCGAVDLHVGIGSQRLWKTPYPDGVRRDYEYPCDMIRMY